MKNLIIASLLLLTSCASGPAYSGHIDEGTKVVVYRGSEFLNFSAKFWVEINGVEVCKLHNGGYLVHDVQPGKINIGSSNWGSVGTSRIAFDIKKGQTVYVKMEMNGQRTFSSAAGGLIGQLTDETISENAGPVYLGVVGKDKANTEMQGLSEECR